MTASCISLTRQLQHACLWTPLVTLAVISWACGLTGTPIIQPGAPGEPARELSADEALAVAKTNYSPDDVRFMHDMIPHHHQALEMSALVADRSGS